MQPPDEVRELQEELHKLKSLAGNRGYEWFIEVLKAQILTRKDKVILTPLESMDQVLKQEFEKGETAGLMLAVCLVDRQIETLEAQIEDSLEQRENEHEPTDEDSTNFTGE